MMARDVVELKQLRLPRMPRGDSVSCFFPPSELGIECEDGGLITN